SFFKTRHKTLNGHHLLKYISQVIRCDCTVSFKVTGYSGRTVIIYCHYYIGDRSHEKYFCMEKNSWSCKDQIKTGLKTTWQHSGRFSLYDNTGENYFKVIIRQLTRQDDGTYWCGVDKPNIPDSYTEVELDVKKGDLMFSGVGLGVLGDVMFSGVGLGVLGDLMFSGVGLGVVLLLLGLLLFMFFRQRRDRDRRPTAAQHSTRPLVPDSMTTNQDPDTRTTNNPIYETATNQNPDTACDINTIYVTATNPSRLHYATVNFTRDPACLHYATVNFTRDPAFYYCRHFIMYCTIKHSAT
uniref:Immunoglobulin domain-containing protein n=1 Tax=Hucho hucho TaxID=62062 RepID=A0A4W5MLD5_9TELE